jgi:hypothetical protein
MLPYLKQIRPIRLRFAQTLRPLLLSGRVRLPLRESELTFAPLVVWAYPARALSLLLVFLPFIYLMCLLQKRPLANPVW